MKRLARSFMAHHLLSGLLSTYLLLLGSLVALGQNGDSKATIKMQSGLGLAVGSYVVPKSSEIPLRDDERLVRIDDCLSVKVERIDGDRMLVSTPDGKRRGSLGVDQVVPFDQAIGYFDQAIAKNPRSADAHWRRGRLWAQRSDNDRALADFNEVIRLAPDHAQCYVDRSPIFVRKQQIDPALADCDKAIQGLPAPRDRLALEERTQASQSRSGHGDSARSRELVLLERALSLLLDLRWEQRQRP
jgi:tetratricopeptide (TPR) repeat protein